MAGFGAKTKSRTLVRAHEKGDNGRKQVQEVEREMAVFSGAERELQAAAVFRFDPMEAETQRGTQEKERGQWVADGCQQDEHMRVQIPDVPPMARANEKLVTKLIVQNTQGGSATGDKEMGVGLESADLNGPLLPEFDGLAGTQDAVEPGLAATEESNETNQNCQMEEV